MATELQRGFKRISTNYLRLGSTLAMGIIEVPLLFYWLGTNGFGLVSLLGPTVGIAVIVLEIVNTSLIRELGTAFHSDDEARFHNAYHASVRITFFAAIITAVVVGAFTLIIPLLNIDPGLVRAAQMFTIMGGVDAMTRVILAPTLSLIVIKEHFFVQNLLLVLYRVIFLLAAVVLFFVMGREQTPFSITMYGIVGFGGNAVMLTGVSLYLWAKQPEIRPSIRAARKADSSEIISGFGWNTAVILATSLADRAPQIIINIIFGTTGNAIYGIAFRLGAYARMITFGLTSGLESVATRISSNENKQERLHKFLVTSTRLHAAVALPAAATLAILAEPLLTLWIAKAVEDPAAVIPKAIPVAQLFVLAMVTRGIGEGWVRILYGDGHVRVYAPVLIVSSIFLPFAVYFSAAYAPGNLAFTLPAAAFAVLWILAYGLLVPLVGARPLQVGLADFFVPMIRPVVLGGLIAAALIGASRSLAPYSLAELLLTLAATVAACAVLAFVMILTSLERRRFIDIARRFIPLKDP